MNTEPGKRTLPLSPHPDHLRKEAKARLGEIKARSPSARLADAQHALARDCGFVSWGHLRAEVIKRGQRRGTPAGSLANARADAQLVAGRRAPRF